MGERDLDCLVVYGTFGLYSGMVIGALNYLTNGDSVTGEGYLVFPLEGEPTFFTFAGRPHDSWIADNRSAHPTPSKGISEMIKELQLERARIGMLPLSGYIGEYGFPHTAYVSLTKDLPQASFEDATDLIDEARKIKSPAEIKCFELACEIGEKAIQSVVDTAKVGVSDLEVKAKILDTRFRNGGDVHSMIIFSSGKEVTHGGQREFQAPARTLERGDLIVTEFDGKYCGYWGQFNQPFSVGEPDKETREMADVATESFNSGLDILKPGITVGDLDDAFQAVINKAGYRSTNPPFHGLGLSLEMPMGTYPMQTMHKPPSTELIEAGMVIEFEPSVVTMDKKKGLTLGSPVLVTETGCRLLSKSWKPELLVTDH